MSEAAAVYRAREEVLSMMGQSRDGVEEKAVDALITAVEQSAGSILASAVADLLTTLKVVRDLDCDPVMRKVAEDAIAQAEGRQP